MTKEDFEQILMGQDVLKVVFNGDLEEDIMGDSKRGLEGDFFNSLEYDTEVVRLQWYLLWIL